MPSKLTQLAHAMRRSPTCILSYLANLIAMLPALPYLALPSGASVDPTEFMLVTCCIQGGILFFAFLAALFDTSRGRWKPALLGFCLCLIPMFLAISFFSCIALAKNFNVVQLHH